MMLCSSFSPQSPQLPTIKQDKIMVSDEEEEEEYIDLEMTTYSILNSPPETTDFEFQMCSVLHLNDYSATSPADELFYKGKLLPLHLPPRLQMVRKMHQNSDTTPSVVTSTHTPFESCNVSPCDSRRVSVEIDPDEHFFEWSTELNGFVNHRPKVSGSVKLKLIKIKDSFLGQKALKASKSFKSMFTKSTCNAESRNVSKARECLNKYIGIRKRTPFVNIKSERSQLSDFVFRKEPVEDGDVNSSSINQQPRRSFSGAIKWHSAKKGSSSTNSSDSSSSSSSSVSFALNDLQLLRRSINADSEIEASVEGAIAHCKQSLQLVNSKKNVNDEQSVMFPTIL